VALAEPKIEASVCHASVSIRQHQSVSVSIRQHPSASVSIRQHTLSEPKIAAIVRHAQLSVSICTFGPRKQVLLYQQMRLVVFPRVNHERHVHVEHGRKFADFVHSIVQHAEDVCA
jgi:hypothetical protein